MNKEYEYSFKAENIENYINYCTKNNYKLEKETEQIRKIYYNDWGVNARLTTDIKDTTTTTVLDFKEQEQNLGQNLVKELRESKPLSIPNTEIEAALSILDTLNYKLHVTLHRIRYVYSKDDIKLEIDRYLSPDTSCVIAIEGNNKEGVAKVYEEIKNM